MSKGSDSYRFFSRAIVILLMTMVCIYLVDVSGASDVKEGKELTKEKYMANYDAYREKLMDKTSAVTNIGVGVVLVGGFIGLYELAAWLVYLLLKSLAPKPKLHQFPNEPYRFPGE